MSARVADPGRPVWRFFHGDWEEHPPLRAYVFADADGLTWEQARDLARAVFRRYVGGGCPPCHREAVEQWRLLDDTEPGCVFDGGVEGEDVRIMLGSGGTGAAGRRELPLRGGG